MKPLLPRRLDTRTLAGATLAALAPGLALAGPQGESVVAGAATVGRPDALTTLVQQTSHAAVINWQQFNVGASEFVVFQQPSSSSVVLNRVIGNDASQIFGGIAANGRVFLSNPNGVLFAPGARLDVNGLVATTFGISDDDFMAGRYAFARAPGAPDAGVVNQGAVQTAAGGFVVLAGDFARNEGVIAAPAGRVLLASGARTTLNLDGMGLVDFAIDEATLSAAAGVSNAGQILAEGGMVVMTARVANQLVSTVVNNTGVVRASRIAEQGGELWLVGQGGDVANSGTLDASGVDGDGGRVVVYGDQDVAHTGTIVADGAGAGAGGDVRAIAAGTLTVAEGSVISARGGPDSASAGGMVEVSGHGLLHLRGFIDLGTGGQLLIDPATVTLINGASSVAGGSVGSVHVQFINAQLNLGNDVKVLAASSIGASASAADIVATNPSGDLFLEIGISALPACSSGIAGGICIAPFGAFAPTAGGNINLAGIDITIAGALNVHAGSAAFGGDIFLGAVTANAIFANNAGARFDSFGATSLTTTGGNISLFGRDNISISGAVSATGGNVVADLDGGSGNAIVTLLGGVSATGAVDVQALGQTTTNVYVSGNATAGGAVTLGAAAFLGGGNVRVTGNVSGGGAVQLQAFDYLSGSSNTRVEVNGSVTGQSVDIDANSQTYGGHVSIGGSVTATGGPIQVDAIGYGSSSSFTGGTIAVAGTLSAPGDISLFAQDNNGGGGGTVSIGAASGLNIFIDALGGAGSNFGGGTIIVGTGTGSGSLAGGVLTATGNAFLNANGTNANSGVIVLGDANVAGNLSLTVQGGPGGGRIVFADLMDGSGGVVTAGTVAVGGNMVANLGGDAGELVAGAIGANAVNLSLTRNIAGGRNVAVVTGDIVATGAGPTDGVWIAVANTGGPGTATIDVGNVTAAGVAVSLDARTAGASGSAASIIAGDISATNPGGATVFIDNHRADPHNGSVTVGDVTAAAMTLYSRNHLTTGNLSATQGIFLEAALGNIAAGDLAATNAGNPVDIAVQTGGTGATITVGAISANGQRAPSGGNDAGASVYVSAGSNGGDVTVTGPISITGTPRAFAGSGSDSYSTFNYSGVAGGARLGLFAGLTGNLNVTAPAGISVAGAGFVDVQLDGATIGVTGPVLLNAAPANVTTTGTLHPYVCTSTCTVNYTETMTNGGDAFLQVGGYGTALIDLGAVTVNGPQASIVLFGQDIQTGALTANGGPHGYLRSSSGTIGGQPHAFSDDFTGGGGEIRLLTGSGTTNIAVAGDVTATGPGFAGVTLAADVVSVGNVSTTTTGGLYIRSGQPAHPAFGDEGPFGQQIGVLPAIDTGTITGGFALIEIGDDGGCSSCDLGPAASVNVGALSATGPGVADIRVNALNANITGAVTAIATAGSRVGVAQYQFYETSSQAYAATESFNFSGGEARISFDGDGTLTVGGALTADGALASIDLGIASGTLQAVTVNITGGTAIMTGTYDAPGTVDDYTLSFQGPGPLQGFIAGPDSGGSGTIVINGPIDVNAVGFGAVIVRAGTLTTGAISLDVANAAYQYFDSRIDGAPVNITAGDAFLAVHDQTGPTTFARATVGGPVAVNAQGNVYLRSQYTAATAPTTINAGQAVTETFAAYVDRINWITCGSSCSLGVYPQTDLDLLTGAIAGTSGIVLPNSSLAFGTGEVANGGDPFVVAQFGLGHANPNGVIKTLGALDLGHVGLAGDYLLIEQGFSDAAPIGTATVGAGAVVQFVRAGGGPLSLEQSGTGSGIFSVTSDVGAFTGAGAELVFGHSVVGGGIAVGTVTAPTLTGESVTLIGPGGITGVNPLIAGSVAIASGAAPATLDTQTATLTVLSASAVAIDNLSFTGATTATLPAGTTAVNLLTGGALTVVGPFTGNAFTANAAGDVTLTGAFTSSGNLNVVTGGLFGASGPLTAGNLVLDGVAGVTDFFATTNAGTIAIDGANAVALDNSARTGGTIVSIVGTSPTSLDVLAGGGLALAGTGFSGTTLTLAGTNLDLGAAAHSASGTMTLTTAGALNAPALLTATAIVIDAVPTTALALTTDTASLSIDAGATLALSNAATGGVTMALPAGITSATLSFAGGATLTGSFSGTSLDVTAAGGLDLTGAAFTTSGAMNLHTSGFFSTTGVLTAGTLLLDGAAGVTDFAAVTNAAAITVDGANSVTLDNSARTGATTVTLIGTSPTSLDVVAGGGLALAGVAFGGTNLLLDGASLALGTASHSATGLMQLTSAGTINATGVLTAGSFGVTAATAVPLAFTTNTGSISIGVPGGSTLSINNNAFTGATSFALPSGLLVANLAFGGNATVSGAFNGNSLNFAAAGSLVLAGASYSTTGTMRLEAGTGLSASGPLSAGALQLINPSGTANANVATNAGAITLDGWSSVTLDNSARTGATTVDFGILTPASVAIVSGGALTLAEAFSGTALSLEGASLDLGAANHSATSGLSLITSSTLNATGTLAGGSLFIDGVPTTAVAITTTVPDLFVAEAGNVTVDCTPVGGTLALGFGSGAFGAINVTVHSDILLSGSVTAASLALSASTGIGGTSGTIVADTLFLETPGDISLGGYTFDIGLGDGATGVSDATLLGALVNAGIGPVAQVVSNGTFLAGGALTLGGVTSAGSYLVLQGDALALTGAISGPSDLLVQVAPATPTNSFSIEDSVAGTAATNYTFSGALGQITAQTLVIGASTSSGAVTIGLNGAFDVTPLNFIVASGGAITDIGNVTSSGIVNTLAGLIAGPVVQPPILEEIDPYVADPAPPVDTSAGVAPAPSEEGTGDGGGEDEEEDDEGEDTSTDAAASEEDAGLVTQQSAIPAGVCGK